MGNNHKGILKPYTFFYLGKWIDGLNKKSNKKKKIPLQERSLKSKKCKKCTYFNLEEGCLNQICILQNIDIRKCKYFGKVETSITGDY